MVFAKPFLKWAGGKGQLLRQFEQCLPEQLRQGRINRYIEPFVGGGAMFFSLAQSFEIAELIICDVNEELMLCYKTIAVNVEALIDRLAKLEQSYFNLSSDQQEHYFYQTRTEFNNSKAGIDFQNYNSSWIERTCQIIILNKTCFNGLFRVNSKGDFNVPFGRYKNPKICDQQNLRAVAGILKRTKILSGDYRQVEQYVDEQSLVYFDPPYRPLSKTSSFTAYDKGQFDDAEQLKLAEFYRLLNQKKALLMLSNSDPTNLDPQDRFFVEAYSGFNFTQLSAVRMINSDAEKRGPVKELMILNY